MEDEKRTEMEKFILGIKILKTNSHKAHNNKTKSERTKNQKCNERMRIWKKRIESTDVILVSSQNPNS